MEENEVKTNEVVNESNVTTSSDATSGRLTSKGKEYDDLSDEINEVKDEKEKSMDDVLNTAKDKVKEAEDKVLEDFLATLDPKVDTFEDLTEEQKAEYEKYKETHLPAMIESVYANAKNKVFEVSKDRMEALNEKEKEGKKLEASLPKEIEERETEIKQIKASGNITEKEEERIKELEAEIAEIKSIMGEFDSRIYGTINKAKDYQKVINNNAIESLSETFKPYPQINVKEDPDLQKINKEIGQKDGQEKTGDEEEPSKDEENKDEQEKTEEEKAKDEKQGKAKGGQIDPAALANAVKAAQAAGTQAAAPAAEEVEEVEQEAPSLSSMLGIDSNNALNFDSSWALLANFTSKDINDFQRLQMLNDPECKKYIINAMKIAGAEKNPFKTSKYRGIRDQVLELAKGPMMEMALRQYGIDNPDNISKSFDELKAKYVKERRAIADDDEKAIAELDEKYYTLYNVEDFQLDSNQLKTIRTRFKDFVGMFSNTEKRKMLSEKIDAKMFKPAEPKVSTGVEEPTEMNEPTAPTEKAPTEKAPKQLSFYDLDRENGTNFMSGYGVNKTMTVEQAKKELEGNKEQTKTIEEQDIQK